MSGYATKVCPRCGEELFADMRVCYGCLYEFPPAEDAASSIDAEAANAGEANPTAGEDSLPELKEDEPFLWDAGLPPSESSWEDDTLDLSSPVGANPTSAPPNRDPQPLSSTVLCWVRTPAVDVKLPIPREGLVVGRDPSSDVVLHSRAVSHSHVRILPAEEGMRVVDLGATNPALFSGREVRGEALVPLGWTVSICGTFVTPLRP